MASYPSVVLPDGHIAAREAAEEVEGELDWYGVVKEEMGSCLMQGSHNRRGIGYFLAGRRQGHMADTLHCICSGRCARVGG